MGLSEADASNRSRERIADVQDSRIPPPSSSRISRTLVWAAMIGSVVAVYPMSTQLDLWTLLFPTVPFALALLLRPAPSHPPSGAIRDVGRTLGHDWADVAGQSVCLSRGAAEGLRERIEPRSHGVVTHGGFRLQVTPSPLVLPRGDWVGGNAAVAVGIGLGLALWYETLMELAPGAGGAGELALAALFSVLPAAVLGFVGGVAANFLVWPHRALLSGLLWLDARRAPTVVERVGGVLIVGSDRFHLGRPGRTTDLDVVEGGPVLHLRNDREHVRVRGRYAELAWLQCVVEAIPEGESGEDAVPDGLRAALAQAGRQGERAPR